MSRILFINKKERFDIETDLTAFAEHAENNPGPEGNWQGDGWGVSWLDPLNNWREFKLFPPIWQNKDFLYMFTPSNTFMAHVRTLAVEEEYTSEENNMPYTNNELAFACDADLLESKVDSADKLVGLRLWEDIQKLDKKNLEQEFKKLCENINLEEKALKSANLVLCDKENVYVYCKYLAERKDYYQIRYWIDESKIIFSSYEIEIEEITTWQKMSNNEFKVIKLFPNLGS
jgi:predicted glutamine amidotransferase